VRCFTQTKLFNAPLPSLARPVSKCSYGFSYRASSRRIAFKAASVPSSSTPISREYPATSAARIAVRRRTGGMSCNLGDIIRDGRDIYGDGVNIAARLETLAEPGAVFVSNTVYEHVRDRLSFAFEDLGEQQVKNIARPLHVYRVRDRAAELAGATVPSAPSISRTTVAAPRLSIGSSNISRTGLPRI
jgi:hypothetical protein